MLKEEGIGKVKMVLATSSVVSLVMNNMHIIPTLP
jgi:hypothetical protein